MLTVGHKYESEGRHMDVAEIAKRVRAEIKAAVASGELPDLTCSVRIRRFAGGCSLDVDLVRAAFRVHTNEYLAWRRADDWRLDFDNRNRYTAHAQRVLAKLERIATSRQRADVDSMSDYWNVSYFEHVGVADELYRREQAEDDAALEALEAERAKASTPSRFRTYRIVGRESHRLVSFGEFWASGLPESADALALIRGADEVLRRWIPWAPGSTPRTGNGEFEDVLIPVGWRSVEEDDAALDAMEAERAKEPVPVQSEPLRYEILWNEGALRQDGTSYDTLGALHWALRRVAADAPEGGAYDKVCVRVLCGDEPLYEARLTVTRDGGGTDLLEHLRSLLAFWKTTRGATFARDHGVDLEGKVSWYTAFLERLEAARAKELEAVPFPTEHARSALRLMK